MWGLLRLATIIVVGWLVVVYCVPYLQFNFEIAMSKVMSSMNVYTIEVVKINACIFCVCALVGWE